MKLALLLIAAAVISNGALPETDRAAIDKILGAKGTYTAPEDTHKVTFPRGDLKVTIEGRAAHPFLGFTSWAAFTTHGNTSMVMGDVVLLEDEVSPAMSAALDNGLEVTALHNHFFYEQPRVMYMHIGGQGKVETLALAVKQTLEAIKATRSASPSPSQKFSGAAVPDGNKITAEPLDRIFGVKGEVNAGMYKVTIGRAASHHGAKIGKQMGVNTWAAFAGTDEAASVAGDFAMIETELQTVLKSLRKAGIHVVAIHNHMTHEEPQYVFLHYWGKGDAVSLARAIQATIALQK